MSKAKHTPGPWKVIKPDHGFKTKYRSVQLGSDNSYTTMEVEPADARLIAAAPNLLSALRELHDSQNGFFLQANRAEWEAAMRNAAALLKSLDG